MPVNKVKLNGIVQIDLTGDTVTEETLAEGVTAHDAAGNRITGRMKAGMTSTKVWENASPTSKFMNQTLTLEMGAYDAAIIEFRTIAGGKNAKTEWIKKGEIQQCTAIVGEENATKYYYALRKAGVTSTGVEFGNATYNDKYNGGEQTFGSTQQQYMIPLAIYGVKGVFVE